MEKHLTPLRPATLRVLDALMGFAVVAALLRALALFADYRDSAATMLAGCALLTAGLWAGWRRVRNRRWFTVALGIVALAIAILADDPFGMFAVGVALLLIVLDHGPRPGAGYVCLVIATIVVLIVAYGHDWVYGAIQCTVNAGMLGLAWLVATMVGRLDRERTSREDLLIELEQAHAELAATHDQLVRSLSTEKELVLADERARTARAVHDGLGHRLTCIRMGLDFADRTWDSDLDTARSEVRAARSLREEALAEMRMWVRALNPPRAQGISGAAAFEDIANAFRGTGLDVSVHVNGPERPVAQDASLFCYRMVQEGLTNALRHAKATQVQIAVTYAETDLQLRVVDNGTPLSDTRVREGFGLRSLRERAESLGGRLQTGWEQQGFALEARVPG